MDGDTCESTVPGTVSQLGKYPGGCMELTGLVVIHLSDLLVFGKRSGEAAASFC